MQTSRKRLKRQASPSSPATQPLQKSWAERHVPLATVIAAYSTLVAVVIAGLGYYFTVIPLYQKAAVDEQLAKREAELKQLDERLAIARTQAYELARARLLDKLATGAAWDCAAGRGRISLPERGAGAENEVNRTLEEWMTLTVSDCLDGFTQRAAKSGKLTEPDLAKLRDATARLGAELDKKRLEALEQIRLVPQRARLDERTLEAATIDTRAMDLMERAAPFLSPEQRARSKEQWFQARVKSVQLGIASRHWSEAADAIRSHYWQGVWPRIEVSK